MVSGLEFRGLQNFRLRFKGFTAGGFGFEAIGFPGWGWPVRVCKCWARDLAFEFTVGFGGGGGVDFGFGVEGPELVSDTAMTRLDVEEYHA